MKKIWFRDYSLSDVNLRNRGTLVEHLGIEVIELGPDFIRGTMPVDHRTKQPAGLLHGGASVALAETLASVAGNLIVDPDQEMCVGLEINANHISACRDGMVTGVSRPLHRGRTTQVWETLIRQDDRMVCISRMTLSVLKKRPSAP
jgi:1,4-dihydroxy-2-naphthoyl-CoA hydrolase